MTSSLQTRTLADLKAVAGDLIESLLSTFPNCSELARWCRIVSEGLECEGDSQMEFLRTLTTHLMTAVPRKMVKYDRAIHSITGSPLTVYQMIMYKDIAPLSVIFPDLSGIDMDAKIKTLSSEDAGMFWQFLHEAMQFTLRCTQVVPPTIPTKEEIAADIERRRRQRDMVQQQPTSSITRANEEQDGGMSLVHGLDDLWKELCLTRNVTPTTVCNELTTRISKHMTATVSDDVLHKEFPELGPGAYSEESIALVRRIGSLCTMKHAIPANMMNGIERVASSLVRDINSGRIDFASLDIERIGQEVLTGVGESDVGEFASNLERILPALQTMGHG